MARALVMILFGFIACGCAQPLRSTRLTAGDYRFTVNQTIQQLITSEFLKDRSKESPAMTVSIERVTNLTSDIIPESEQWMFVLSVWQSEAVKQITAAKNIRTQVTPHRLAMIRQQFPEALSAYIPPTHVMTAVFETATRTGASRDGIANARTDQYQMLYTINELASGETIWSGIVEFKREARGNLID